MAKFLEKLERIVLLITALLTPLVFTSLFPNPFGLPKLTLLGIGVGLALLLRAASTINKGSLTLYTGKFDLAVFVLALAYILSAIFRTSNKMEAFFLPGSVTFVTLSALYYFLAGGLEKKILKNTLFIVGVIYSLTALLAFSGVLAKIPQLPAFVKDIYFNPEGSILVSAFLMVISLSLGLILFLKEKEATKKLFYAVSLTVLILGLGISVFNLLPGKAQALKLPGLKTSWVITAETLKESPFLGIGAGNYLSAFNLFRPIGFNDTELWSVRFSSANNFYFNLVTEAGLLGLGALILLLFAIYQVVKKDLNKEGMEKMDVLPLVVFVVLSFLFPLSQTLIFVLILLLILAGEQKEITLKLSNEGASALPAVIVSLPLIVGVCTFAYFGSKALLAEYKFQQALTSLSQNNGKAAYDKLREVLTLSPYVDRYHATYAQVNMALVQALAQKKDLTENDKTTIAQLVQQAIREGKATVTLNLGRSANWEVLGRIYQTIIPIAQGSDSFAIQTYTQALALDPLNVNLRITLGGVYYSLGRYDEAVKVFEGAVLVKPDLPNAHYNLALAYREKGEVDKAIEQMKVVLSLVSKDSKDFELATAELTNLESKKPVQKESGEDLTPPPTAEKQIIKPPLDLPEEANPPATQ